MNHKERIIMNYIVETILFDKEIIKKFLNTIDYISNEVLKIYNSNNLFLEIKNDKSPITLADKISHKILVSFLEDLKFNIPIISEENFTKSTLNYGDLPYWLIDPLDGTKEFIAKNDEFTINIALIKNKKTIFGFVGVPCNYEIYWGGKNFGSWKKNIRDDHKIKLKVKKLSQKIKIAVSRSHLSLETKNYLNRISDHYELHPAGSSLKFLMIAEGKIDLYPRLEPTSEWDTAAAQAVLEGAGGRVLSIDNHMDLQYSKSNIRNPFFLAFGDTNILKKISSESTK